MPTPTAYRGRFAPSPTGPLHFGSLVAAVASYLDARQHHGNWLIRMEDIDLPRCAPGAAEDILRVLHTFGLHSDAPVLYQSRRQEAYAIDLQRLKVMGAAYPCCCTRKEIADSALHGIEGYVYPGTCRAGMKSSGNATAWRIRTDLVPSLHRSARLVKFDDEMQGTVSQNLEREIGDFVVKRADGLFAYQLAVVVDDALQGITHVVRGADLLASTPRQIHLQHLLGYTTPHYMHLPVAVNAEGEKLSKQTLAPPLDTTRPEAELLRVLAFLRQPVPNANNVEGILEWAIRNWDATRLHGMRALPC